MARRPSDAPNTLPRVSPNVFCPPDSPGVAPDASPDRGRSSGGTVSSGKGSHVVGWRSPRTIPCTLESGISGPRNCMSLPRFSATAWKSFLGRMGKAGQRVRVTRQREAGALSHGGKSCNWRGVRALT